MNFALASPCCFHPAWFSLLEPIDPVITSSNPSRAATSGASTGSKGHWGGSCAMTSLTAMMASPKLIRANPGGSDPLDKRWANAASGLSKLPSKRRFPGEDVFEREQ